MRHDLPAFALLIDADNVRTESIGPIFAEITRHARVTVRRIYGDFTTPNLAGWKVKLAENAIHPIQQYRNSVGKNAAEKTCRICKRSFKRRTGYLYGEFLYDVLRYQ